MLIYANRDAVEKWTGQNAPDNWERLVKRASTMVGVATRMARYEVTPAGLPADDDQAEAMRDAVCAQVSAWDKAGIDPAAPETEARVSKTSMDGASFEYDRAAEASERTRVATTLCEESYDILRLAGLIGGHPWQR
ncbi:hypothetical protein PQI66_09815 [Corynebacterium sp. USCH3]|uniref:hypothetical protein n=1 Tax=Corynebacterium sp. USCH3 TaxID=3024840 RepID=UPI00309AF0FE